MKIPLVIKDLEAKTDDPEEKALITRILEMKEASLSESLTCQPLLSSAPIDVCTIDYTWTDAFPVPSALPPA